MDYSVDIRLKFDGGADMTVPLAAPFTIKQTRGLDPYMFSLVMPDISQLPPATAKNGVGATFTFSTPGESGGRADVSWKLYLVRTERNKAQEELWNVVFADGRWLADYKRYTLSYNIQWPDGSYRNETTNGGQRWKAVDAIEHAIREFGFEPDVSRIRKRMRANPELPNNLGNSDGGGWVDATWTEIIGPMLNVLNADLVIGLDGKWIVVPKTDPPGKTTSGNSGQVDPNSAVGRLRAMKRTNDTVEAAGNLWERPRKIRVGFEIMAEAAIESDIPTTSTAKGLFDIPENVMPRLDTALLDPEAWWNDQVADQVADTDWVRIYDELLRLGYISSTQRGEQVIAENYFLPCIIPIIRAGEYEEISEDPNPTQNSIKYQTKLWMDAALRQHWRRTYRITYPTSGAEGVASSLRGMAGIRFGRLTPGGDARSRGSVFCQWCEESSHALVLTPNPLDSQFSQNHDFDPERAAPFTAQWIAQKGNELIFQLTPTESRRISQGRIFPGAFSVPLNYGTWFNMTGDGYMQAVELQGQFTEEFDYRIYVCGMLTREDERAGVGSPVGEINGRRLVVEAPLFSNGSIESLDVKSSAVTANFAYSKTQMALPLGELALKWPTELINSSEIRRVLDRATVKAIQQFETNLSGGITIAGVSPVAAGIITEGDVHEMSIVVGSPDPWSIVSQYIIQSAVSSFDIDQWKRDGEKPSLIAAE